MLFSAETPKAAHCVEYGEYSNIAPPAKGSIEGEISGIEIELWKCDDKILGLFSEYCGLPADPPTGKLDAIKYDSISGNLSFKVKISLGSMPGSRNNEMIDSRDIYSFSGKVKRHKYIKGKLELISDRLDRIVANTKTITLKYDENQEQNKNKNTSILKLDLEKRISEILDFRGPKW